MPLFRGVFGLLNPFSWFTSRAECKKDIVHCEIEVQDDDLVCFCLAFIVVLKTKGSYSNIFITLSLTSGRLQRKHVMQYQKLQIGNYPAKMKLNNMTWKTLSVVIFQWNRHHVLLKLMFVLMKMTNAVHWKNAVR